MRHDTTLSLYILRSMGFKMQIRMTLVLNWAHNPHSLPFRKNRTTVRLDEESEVECIELLGGWLEEGCLVGLGLAPASQ